MRKLVNENRIFRDLEELKKITDTQGKGVTRFSYSESDKKARAYLLKEAKAFGLKAETDKIGNMFIKLPENSKKEVIMTGSHIDSVREGGYLDGSLGVICGLEVLRRVREKDLNFKKTIWLVVFVEEEGSNFNATITGSKFLTGEYGEEDLDILKNKDGATLRRILKENNYPEFNSEELKPDFNNIKAMIELHIEQGPVLDRKGISLGIVENINGMKVHEITVTGLSNHAGASPMTGRKDALVFSSECVLKTKEIIERDGKGSEVATVGHLEVSPNMSNVIPGRVKFTLEVRGPEAERINSLSEMILSEYRLLAERENVEIDIEKVAFSKPYRMDKSIVTALEETAKKQKEPYLLMNSGAVHDTGSMSSYIPSAMIFVPSIDGRSHVSTEETKKEDIIKGANLLMETLLSLAD
ncbi:MAG: M20 family metallo-hydrolase [Clostridiales bacterium]|nr:M20 family metallo-hydrolase [Clostridiales bacterium]